MLILYVLFLCAICTQPSFYWYHACLMCDRHHVTSKFFVKIEKNLLPSSAEIGNTSPPDPIPEFESSTRFEFLSPLLQHTAHPRTGHRTRPTPSCVRIQAQQEPRCLYGRTRYLAERRRLGSHIYYA